MQKDQFFDLKQLALDVGQNFKINQTGENVFLEINQNDKNRT